MNLSLTCCLLFQIIDAAQAAYEVRNLSNTIINLAMANILTVLGSMEFDEMLSQRDSINMKVSVRR
ncbi:Putative stomatin/prohibitin-family membrane protease subunit YbbK [Citrobacter pasteurii]|nr:Putative stomatin/prohibitin-family membrane protease subunit YbbK [Citrobacter pasteurii]